MKPPQQKPDSPEREDTLNFMMHTLLSHIADSVHRVKRGRGKQRCVIRDTINT